MYAYWPSPTGNMFTWKRKFMDQVLSIPSGGANICDVVRSVGHRDNPTAYQCLKGHLVQKGFVAQ